MIIIHEDINGECKLYWNSDDIDTKISKIMNNEYPLEFTNAINEQSKNKNASEILAKQKSYKLYHLFLEWEKEKIKELKYQKIKNEINEEMEKIKDML